MFFVLSRAPDNKIVPSLKKKRTSNLLIPRSAYTYQKLYPKTESRFRWPITEEAYEREAQFKNNPFEAHLGESEPSLRLGSLF